MCRKSESQPVRPTQALQDALNGSRCCQCVLSSGWRILRWGPSDWEGLISRARMLTLAARAHTCNLFLRDIFRLRMHSSSFESKRFDHRGSISCLALKRTHGRPHESCRHILRVDVFHTVSAVWYKPTPKPTLHTLPLSLSWMLGIGASSEQPI